MCAAREPRPPRGHVWRRLWACERAQVSFALVFALFALAPLLGLVANTGRAVRAKIELQGVADKAAYAASGTIARGFNFLSNCNVAQLELAALAAMMESIEPTYEEGMRNLDFTEWGSFLLPFAGELARAKAKQERQVLEAFRRTGQAFGQARPAMEQARDLLAEVERGVATSLPALAMAAAYEAARAEDEHVRLLPTPPQLRLPIRFDRLIRSFDKGNEIRYRLAKPVLLLLEIGAPMSGAWDAWSSTVKHRFKRLLEAPPEVPALDQPPGAITREYVDRHFRGAWTAIGKRVPWWMPGVFGGEADAPTTAMAEAMVYNPERWDLVTPRWEAVLVPVSKIPAASGFLIHH